MILALKIAVDRPNSRREAEAAANLLKTMDKLLVEHEVEPVTWLADEDEDRLYFEAYIPADCRPEFDIVSDLLTDCYSGFNQSTE